MHKCTNHLDYKSFCGILVIDEYDRYLMDGIVGCVSIFMFRDLSDDEVYIASDKD